MFSLKPHRTYLAMARPWKVRNMVEEYLRAWQIFVENHHVKATVRHMISFDALHRLSEALMSVKEDHHLIFRRSQEPESRLSRHKLVPTYADSAFIDHVGLLFHKAMVAKELRYILDRYAHDEQNWQAHFQELQANLQRIAALFEKGADIIANLMRTYSDNVLLLAFLMENQRTLARAIGVRPTQVLGELVTKLDSAEAYYLVAQYYYESGWYDRAGKAVQQALAHNPGDQRALALLQQTGKKNNNKPRGKAKPASKRSAKASHAVITAS